MIEHLVTIIDQIDIIPSAGLALGIYHTIAQSMLEIRAVSMEQWRNGWRSFYFFDKIFGFSQNKPVAVH